MASVDRLLAACASLVLAGGALSAGEAGLPAGMSAEDFFRARILPLLAENCWRCHGPRKQRNNLRLDSRAAVLQGGHMPDVEPGHPERSRLMDAVGYEDGDLEMPPDGKLAPKEIADLATWIRLGVPWAEPTTRADAGAGKAAPPGR